jgi:hypothetical protein
VSGRETWRRRLARAAALVAALAAAPAALAVGVGGDDPANAPELRTIVRQFEAKFGPDYWRVYLNVGDLMTLDYSSTDGDRVGFCLLPPTATPETTPTTTTTETPTAPEDTTTPAEPVETPAATAPLADDACAGRASTFTKERVTLSVVNPPGYWMLVFADGLCAPHNYATECATYDVAYSATLTVRRFTQVIVSAPATARLAASITVSGRVIGMTGGHVEIQIQRQGKWRSYGLTPINATGQFSRKLRLPNTRATYPFKVTFYGDSEHRPSGRTFAIRVA